MVNPIYIFAIAIGLGFLLSLIDKLGRNVSIALVLATLGYFVFLSASWFLGFLADGSVVTQIYTAGFKPPFSINLQLGLEESFFLLLINSIGLLSIVYLIDRFKTTSIKPLILFLMAILGFNGIVMTRDLFNLFVFIEVASIAVYSLVVFDKTEKALSAGFKYLAAGSVASAFLLIGTIYLYRFTGTLNLDGIGVLPAGSIAAGVAVFFLFIALVIELKPFPANGWALDVYESVNPGVAALISGAAMTASYFALAKILPIFGGVWYEAIMWVGLITFVGSNLVGIKQTNSSRLLGYSSLGQVGLLMVILGFSQELGDKRDFIAAGILFSHVFAKAGLFWIAGIVKAKNIKEWAVIRKKPLLLVGFATFIFTLIGMPPFPSFFAKWELVMALIKGNHFIVVALILLFSFFEGLYLFRWFGFALKLDIDKEAPELNANYMRVIPIVLAGLFLYSGGYYAGLFVEAANGINYIPLAFIAFIGLIDVLPSKVKNTISIAGVVAYSIYIFPNYQHDIMKLIFLFIFLGGAVITLFGGYYASGRRSGFHAMALTMFAGLVMLIEATTLLQFFYGWELMSIGSYFLLIRGKKSMPHGFSYMLFSLGGAYAIMYAFGLAFAGSGDMSLLALKDIAIFPALAYSLMLLGFMTKTASIGLHIWLPGAHGEAVADIHFMASAILLKAGVYGIIVVLLAMGKEKDYAVYILLALGWFGAISALVGNLTAVFQESAKRLLAWSSIGQIGYIIFALASMSYLGWVAGLFYSIAHFLYKGILFSVVGGVALKLGTPNMYKMGGLIKQMPFSFFAVLIAIITLAGIPPLAGFTGKWLFYNIILSEKLLFQGAMVMVSGMIAFLYLFRLIHTIFLGQPKDELREVGEISTWLLIPVYFLISVIMYISMYPKALLEPLGKLVQGIFPSNAMTWEGSKAVTQFGYFDGTMIMHVVLAVFVAVFLLLFYYVRRAHKLKQFNIVYSGEAPELPETTHYAYNFLASYKKGIGILAEPFVDRFWAWISESVHSISNQTRKVYTGNGQTYILHIMVYTVVFYFFVKGGF